jgi:hypothetical protein
LLGERRSIPKVCTACRYCEPLPHIHSVLKQLASWWHEEVLGKVYKTS